MRETWLMFLRGGAFYDRGGACPGGDRLVTFCFESLRAPAHGSMPPKKRCPVCFGESLENAPPASSQECMVLVRASRKMWSCTEETRPRYQP
ncbi:hypothetical protein BaRGS_00035389 [Batillaria attramentaria]|uniref:Uncharacterized protein n=1 Tax=Batillaria attramentaria TaxID=370345 RepID=A0ABD0JFG8_9CAEN